MSISEKIRDSSGVLEDAESATRLSRVSYLDAITAATERHANGLRVSQISTAIAGLSIVRSDRPIQPLHDASETAIHIAVQGGECVMIGETRHEYDAGQAITLSIDEPFRCIVPDATFAQPHLGLVIELDRLCTQQAIEQIGIFTRSIRRKKATGASVIDLSPQFLNCVLRAVLLLDTPAAIPMLYPGIKRERCYWLLTGPACEQIVELAVCPPPTTLESYKQFNASRESSVIRFGLKSLRTPLE